MARLASFALFIWPDSDVQKVFYGFEQVRLARGILKIIRVIVQDQQWNILRAQRGAERLEILNQAAQIGERDGLLIGPLFVLRARGHAFKTNFGRGFDKNIRVGRRIRERGLDDIAQDFVKIVLGARDNAFRQHVLAIDITIRRRARVNKITRGVDARGVRMPDAHIIIKIARRVGECPTARILKIPFEKWILFKTF